MTPTRQLTPGPWSLELVKGWAAVAAAITQERRQEWQALADEAKHVSVYQAPAFVLTWYEVYAPVYEPLLLLGRAPDRGLVGILPLALSHRPPRRLVFAGAGQCEYAGWLAAPDIQEEFPARCVSELHREACFRQRWDWGWLAPGLSTQWLDHPLVRSRGVRGRALTSCTPLLALQEPGRPRFFAPNGKNFKRKLNRLKGLGEVRLVRFDSASMTDELFHRFTTCYDIRQLARYGVAPFNEDPLKGPFHRRLLERGPEVVRCFALLAGSTPVAFHWSLVDQRRAIYSMSPFDQRLLEASPGKLIGDLLVDALREEGVEYLDHTPGGDAYKEESASTTEAVLRLQLFPSSQEAWLHAAGSALTRLGKRCAVAAGLSPEAIGRLRGLAGLARGRSPLDLLGAALRALRRWAWSRDAMIVYRLDRETWERQFPALRPDPLFRLDALEDFLHYTGSIRWRSRQRMMADAIERLNRGEHCFTVVEDNALIYSSWIQLGPSAMHLTEIDVVYPLPPDSGVLYDAYTEPLARGRGLHTRNALERRRVIFDTGARCCFNAILESNAVSRRIHERAGSRPIAKITWFRRFGRSWWTQEAL